MFSSKRHRKGFTLIEMLIVIVIIGILAAALIPRLSSARGRANDVARKADLAQVAAALVSYQIDHGSYPTTAGALSSIETDLNSAGMDNIPSDPNTTKSFTGITTSVITGGQYGYTPIKKGGITDGGFVLMAGTETAGGSNRVYTGNITSTMDYEDITLCKSIEEHASITANNDGVCTYVKTADVLRYIYLY